MQGRTHLIVGATTGLAAGLVAGTGDWTTLALYAGVGGLSGLAPDWFQISVPGASRQVKGAFGHRGFSHWVWTALLVAWLAWPVMGQVGGALLAGWLSHILLDTLSGGAPAFWPFGRLRLARIKTGGKIDGMIGWASLAALAIWCSWNVLFRTRL